MVIHVKDVETDRLVRQLARMRGMGITEAIREAAREAIASDNLRVRDEGRLPLHQQLQPVLQRLDRLPRATVETDKAYFDELWGEGETDADKRTDLR